MPPGLTGTITVPHHIYVAVQPAANHMSPTVPRTGSFATALARRGGWGKKRVRCVPGVRKDAGEGVLGGIGLIRTAGCTATCTGKGYVRYTGLGGRERGEVRAVQLHKWGREAGLEMEELSSATTRCHSNREITSDTNCDNRPRTGDLRWLPCGRMPWPADRFSGQAPPRAPSSTAWRSCLPVSSSPP